MLEPLETKPESASNPLQHKQALTDAHTDTNALTPLQCSISLKTGKEQGYSPYERLHLSLCMCSYSIHSQTQA